MSNINFKNVYVKLLILLTFLIFIVPFLARTLYKAIQKNTDVNTKAEALNDFQGNINPAQQIISANQITASPQLQAIAKEVAHHLGTAYSDNPTSTLIGINWSFLNPRGWTENDQQVYDLLKNNALNYNVIAQLYHDVYTNKRNLSNDVLSLLDNALLQQLKNYINL